jgi:hypothetical protein
VTNLNGTVDTITFDLINPDPKMFQQNGETPIFAIFASHPMYSQRVVETRETLLMCLHELMGYPDDKIVVMQQDEIEMESGETTRMTVDTLIISLQYEEATAKLITLELCDQGDVTLH